MRSFSAGRKKVWTAIKRLDKSGEPKRGAIAYLTDADILDFREGDELIVDASYGAIKYGQTSKKAIIALSKKVRLYSFEDLHAKVLILGDMLIVGSMNASSQSQKVLAEAALITDNPGAVHTARVWLDEMVEEAEPIDDEFIERIRRIKVERRGRRHGARKKTRLPSSLDGSDDRWFYFLTTAIRIKAEEADDLDKRNDEIKEQLDDGARDVSWIRFSGGHPAAARLKRGDHIFLGYRPHKKSKRIMVTPYCRVESVESRNTKTIVFYTYPFEADDMAMPWKRFQRMAKDHAINLSDRAQSKTIRDSESAAALLEAWHERAASEKS